MDSPVSAVVQPLFAIWELHVYVQSVRGIGDSNVSSTLR